MKRFIKRALLLLLLASLTVTLTLPLTSCGGGGDTRVKNRVFYDYFDTVCVVYDYTGGTYAKFNELCELIEGELATCHKLFDIYNDYDGVVNLKAINDNAGGAPLAVDKRIIELLEFSHEMYTLTRGHTNVAMGAVLSLWHDLRTEGVRIPTEAELSSRGEHTDISDMVIDRTAGTVALLDPEMSLDVGAVAKGFTAERIAKMLKERGISGYALDFGGNLRTVGEKPNGDGWVSGITNPTPNAKEPYVRTVTVKDGALVTSGTYQRFYTVGGVSYHHIINKDTLMPKFTYLSVTVQTKSSAIADALSTAIFNMEIDEAEQFVSTLSDTEVTLVMADGSVRVLC